MIDIFYYDKKLMAAKLSDISKLKNKPVWIDITGITKEESLILKNVFKLHPLTAEDLLGSVTRIKVERFPNYLFCIFYGIIKNKKLDLIELDFIIGKNFLITQHKPVVDSFEDLKKNTILLEGLFKKGLDFIFHHLIDEEVSNYFPVLEDIDDGLESIEEEVSYNPKPIMASRILSLKRELVQIRRLALPQREKLSNLSKTEYEFISDNAVPYFRDVYDHSVRVADSIEMHVEQVTNAFEIYMSAVNNNMNEVMKIFSMIATIALPLTVISSIYGTNFRHIPGLDNYFGFYVMIGSMIFLSTVMIIFFKRKGWF